MDRRSRSRSRSRSASPRGDRREYPRDGYRGRDDFRDGRDGRDSRPREKDRERLERERRERMARLRAENEAEEKGDLTASGGGEKGEGAAAKRQIPLPEHKAKKSKGGDDDEEEVDEEQAQMMQMMGFGGFGTTKGKAVSDNQSSAARGAASKNKGRKYRQYMNRKGGFNRPLDKMN